MFFRLPFLGVLAATLAIIIVVGLSKRSDAATGTSITSYGPSWPVILLRDSTDSNRPARQARPGQPVGTIPGAARIGSFQPGTRVQDNGGLPLT